jgi:DNA-binding NtrC family response regulator
MKLTLKNHRDGARVLIASPDDTLLRNLSAELREANYHVEAVQTVQAAAAILGRGSIDVVITDCRADGSVSNETVRLVGQSASDTEIVLLIGGDAAPQGSEVLYAGAFDTVLMPIPTSQLLAKVQRALEHRRMKQELTLLRQHVAMAYGFDNIVGESKAIVQLRETARRIAPTDIPILITGEDGTGKELLARTIHHHSIRRRESFVAVDCATVPQALLEEELFGRWDTSASASENKTGLLEQAQGGTVYLENVHELPASTQSQLVRLFQYSEITPLGAPAPTKVSLRVIASSAADLAVMVADGRFRKDLFNHINVIILNIPTLKERTEDIEILTDYFLRAIAQEQNTTPVTVSRQAREALVNATWPGNIRQLENVLKRAAGLCHNGRIEADDIILVNAAGSGGETQVSVPAAGNAGPKGLLADSQRAVIIQALEDNDWNFTQTAQMLGIGRTTLWRKVRKYNLRQDGGRRSLEEQVASE